MSLGKFQLTRWNTMSKMMRMKAIRCFWREGAKIGFLNRGRTFLVTARVRRRFTFLKMTWAITRKQLNTQNVT